MIQSPQTFELSRDGVNEQATVAWRYESADWVVHVESTAFGSSGASADDAFEALCLIREELEPQGWRLGVAGAQLGVWPSGMSRDMGGGLTAYRMTADGAAASTVDTFQPVDPATVTTVAAQRAEIERLWELRRNAPGGVS